jgi:hypothetical protein
VSLLLLLRPRASTPEPPPVVSVETEQGFLRILGAAQLGSTLSVDTSTLGDGPFTYQWMRAAPVYGSTPTSWTLIVGATAATYTLGTGDVGQMISVIVDAASGGAASYATGTYSAGTYA